MSHILSRNLPPVYRATDARPDQHARRNGRPAGGVPQPVVLDEVSGQVFVPADADVPAEGTGLLSPEALTLGMLASGAPFIPDVELSRDPFAEQLNDDGRNEVAGYDSLAAMVQRRCPGVLLSLTVLWRRSYAADGAVVPGRRQTINVAATDGAGWADSVGGDDPEEVFGCIAGKWLAAHAR